MSFEVRSGEIFGIAGVAGNGQDELVEALLGLRPIATGRVTLGGRDVTGASPRRMHQLGVGFVPADRHRYGIVLSFPLTDNLVPQRLLPRTVRPRPCAQRRRDPQQRQAGDRRVRRAHPVGHRDRRNPLRWQPAEGGRRPRARSASCGCSSSTSRRAGSTWAASSSSIARRSRSATRGWPCSSFPPSSTRCSSSATGSRSCTAAASSRSLDARSTNREEVGLLMATGGREGPPPQEADLA